MCILEYSSVLRQERFELIMCLICVHPNLSITLPGEGEGEILISVQGFQPSSGLCHRGMSL